MGLIWCDDMVDDEAGKYNWVHGRRETIWDEWRPNDTML